jgi:hypothetical protein
LFVVAFMALDSVRFSRRLALARPERPEIVGALDSFVAGTRSYLLVSTIFGLIVAAIDTGFVIGAMGAILAVPLTLLTKALLLDVDPSTRWMSGLIAGGPAPPEDAADDVATTRAGPKPASDEVASHGAASEDASPPGIALAGDG